MANTSDTLMLEYNIKNENQIKVIEAQNKMSRLASFKQMPKECLLPVALLSFLGFFYDHIVEVIRCCACTFYYKNLKSPYTKQLIYQHYQFNEKCANIKIQIEYIKDEIETRKMEVDEDIDEKAALKIMMKKENRLKTFENLELKINHDKLVENGFYIEKDANLLSSFQKIVCAFCSYNCVINKNYHLNTKYEDPFEEHKKISPQCQKVMEISKSNSGENQSIIKTEIKIDDIFMEQKSFQSALYNNPENFELVKNVLGEILNSECDKPFHSGYITEQSRLESFKNWPANQFIVPADLAKAGFYYCGYQDQVRCFFCNGIRKDWDPTDEPIWEHARWFPKCSYIRQLMGSKFLDEVKERYQNQPSGFTDDSDDKPQYYDLVLNETDIKDGYRNSRAENRPAVNQNQVENQQQRSRAPSPRTINSRLDLPGIRKLIDLGINRNTLKQVIEKKLIDDDGKDFDNLLDLVKECTIYEENSKKLQKRFKKLIHIYVSNIPYDIKNDEINELFKKLFNIVPIIYNFYGIFLISMLKHDLYKLDKIVDELNGKSLPNSKLANKIIVKKTVNQSDINEISNRLEFTFDNDKVEKIKNEPLETTESDDAGLVQEVEKLKKESECIICMKELKNTLLLPCSHLVTCVECSRTLLNCPLCRIKIEATVRVYS